jgi:hypothetical protein
MRTASARDRTPILRRARTFPSPPKVKARRHRNGNVPYPTFCVYILGSKSGVLYVSFTNDLARQWKPRTHLVTRNVLLWSDVGAEGEPMGI